MTHILVISQVFNAVSYEIIFPSLSSQNKFLLHFFQFIFQLLSFPKRILSFPKLDLVHCSSISIQSKNFPLLSPLLQKYSLCISISS